MRPLAAAVALVVVVWGWLAFGWMREVRTIRQELEDLPGFALLSIESEGRGALSISGLHDPAALDPRSVLSRTHPGVRADWRMPAYVSSEPEVIVRRARQQLALPDSVSARLDKAGVLHLQGALPYSKWYALKERPPTVQGVNRIAAIGLEYPGRPLIDALIADIQGIRVDFADGAVLVEPNAASLRRLVAALEALQARAHESGMAIHVRTYGFTDEPGSLGVNRQLRLRRAEWLGETVRARLGDPIDIDASMDTVSVRFHGRHRAANAQVTVTPR